MKSRTRNTQKPIEIETEVSISEIDRDADQLPQQLDVTPPAAPAPSGAMTTAASNPVAAPGAKAAYPLAIIAALLWIGGVASYAAYEIGSGRLVIDPVNATLLTLIALAPAGLVLVIAHLVRQAESLAAETRRARSMADNLGLPTGIAVQESGQMLIGLRSDIELSAQAAESARSELAAMRVAMEEETRRLNEAADLAQRTARRLSEQLAKEREGLTTLGTRLETQTQNIIDTVDRQARMVADASDLAQTQLREAEAALAARTANMAGAASEAQDAARAAADDLSRQTMRLETAGSGVADQIRSVEEGLSEQRAALVQAAFGLRRDQEDFAAQVETQRAQLTESLADTHTAASEMRENSALGAESLQSLLESATDQIKALSDMAQTEGRAFDTRTREALDRFEDLAAQARENAIQESERTLADLQSALDSARQATETAVETARLRLDGLAELAFEAGRVADQSSEDRLQAARRVVEETAALGDDAAQRIAARLEENLLEARAALAHVEDAIIKIDERAARLPVEAKARAEEVKAAVEASLETLAEASRRTAAETEAADAAFQDRVKRNYDMLSEAVQLMGVVSGEGPQTQRRAATAPSSLDEAGLRGRLRLTPTSRDDEVRQTFDAPPAPLSAGTDTEPMSWKELLAGAGDPDDDQDGPDTSASMATPEILFADLTAGIRELGIDPSALLPRARVEEAAVAIENADEARARDIVRRVAPAAVRRISRRVLTDRQMRADVDQFVRGYAASLTQARKRKTGEPTGQMLGTDAGRTYLLLDAAVGDLS